MDLSSSKLKIQFSAVLFVLVFPAAILAEPSSTSPIRIVKHSWNPLERFDQLGKTRYIWSATIRNEAGQSRKVCLEYLLLEGASQTVARHEACQVVGAEAEIDVGGQAFLDSQKLVLVDTVRAVIKEDRELMTPFSFKSSILPRPPAALPLPVLPTPGENRQVIAVDGEFSVTSHRWRYAERQDQFGSARLVWNASVRNSSSESRKICVNYDLQDEVGSVVVRSSGCRVVEANSEAEIEQDAYVSTRVLKNVRSARAIPAESHRLHSFVRVPVPE